MPRHRAGDRLQGSDLSILYADMGGSAGHSLLLHMQCCCVAAQARPDLATDGLVLQIVLICFSNYSHHPKHACHIASPVALQIVFPPPCLQLRKRAALRVFNRKDRLLTSDNEILVVMRGALRLQLQASAFLAKPGRSR